MNINMNRYKHLRQCAFDYDASFNLIVSFYGWRKEQLNTCLISPRMKECKKLLSYFLYTYTEVDIKQISHAIHLSRAQIMSNIRAYSASIKNNIHEINSKVESIKITLKELGHEKQLQSQGETD